MAQQINVSDTITLYPNGYSSANSSYSSISSSYPISNGYDGADSNNYAYITCNTGSRAETHISYTFDVSDIPAEATISSVACQAKVRVSSTSYISTAVVQLYSGSTAKGSSTSARTTTATAYTLTPGTWTRSEINNIQVRYTGTRGTSNTTRAAYLYFYGATLSITYAIEGMEYTVTAVSETDGATVEPLAQNIMEGNSATVTIYASSLDDIVVKDNEIDVTENLVQHTTPTGGTLSQAPASYTVSGSVSGTRYRDTVGHTVDNPSSQSGNDYCSSSGSTATIYYHFDFSDLPDNATITSMTVQAHGHLENSSNSNEVAELNVYNGTTAKGTAISYTSTSSQTRTISPGTWTVAELKEDPRVGFTIGYYGGLTTGITWTVAYDVPSSGNPYYWTYTLNNIDLDHSIVVEQSGPYVPPTEDPQYNYYPITISSINATTDPYNGTTRVQEGTTQVVTISPTDPQLTLALDNGVDITSQLVGGVPNNTYTVTTQVSGASYGFNLNSSTGYYVSTNNGVNKSASVARLNLDLESDCIVTIQYINYAEANYDYGLFGKLDVSVATDGLTAGSNGSSPSDSTNNYELAMASNSSSTQTISYTVPMGQHFIDIKYGKDDASNANNDNLQWKVASIQATSAGGDYTYTLSNVNQKHSLIFIFGDVSYYFITSSTNSGKIFPDGQVVKLEGDNYSITIIPNSTAATVTLKDNNIDKTSTLQRIQGQDKSGNQIVNYTYTLTNITAAHTIAVTISTSAAQIYIKMGNSWQAYTNVYKKVNGSWVKQMDLTSVFNSSTNYVQGKT